ncbi:MAG: glutathione S-transferase [Methylococcales bacterium]|nr:glutathione S-transferase [Methylococcales bacterium]
MRARLAIVNSMITVELREVVLSNKPQQLLTISPKGTIPVLVLNDGQVIEQSLDIMTWTLSKLDPDNWLKNGKTDDIYQLIAWNDNEFKYFLDRYKYADRYPEHTRHYYREKAEQFLNDLEQRLALHPFLCSDHCSLADIAIFPFIRQFAHVDKDWFRSSDYQNLNQWLNHHLHSALFISIMDKYPAWQLADKAVYFNIQN